MDVNSMIIISGLVAFVVAYAAVLDSEGGWSGVVGPMHWSFSGSWASSSAVVLAAVLTLTGLAAGTPQILGFGFVMVLVPLIYRGLGQAGGASKVVFFIFSAMMSWATFSILYVAATNVPNLVESMPLLSGLIIDAALVLALVGAVLHSARSLASAASGDGSAAWNLP